MPDETCKLVLQFGSSQAVDDSELDRLARRFNLELQNEGEDIDSKLATDAAPERSKAGIGGAIGALAIQLAPKALPVLIDRIWRFLTRSPNRSVKVKIQLGNKSVEIEYPGEKALSIEDVSNLVETLTGSVSRTRLNS
jgi:hypothetical protein